MESKATVGGDAADPSFTTGSPLPLDIQAFFAQIPDDDYNMEDLLRLDESAGHAPLGAGDTSHHTTIAGLRQAVHPVGLAGGATAATGVEEQRGQNAYACLCFDLDWTSGTGPGHITGQPATYSVVNPGPLTGADMAEIPYSGSAPTLGSNMQEVNAALTPSAAVKGILSVENPPQEPTWPVVNVVGLAMPERDRDPYSTGDTSCPSASAAAGLPQSGGGGALTEAPVRGSCKRKKLVFGSSSQSSTPELELEAGLVQQSNPSSLDIKPPDGSTHLEIIQFLVKESRERGPSVIELNHSVAKEDQNAPKAVRSYVTTEMMDDLKTHLGYWMDKKYEGVMGLNSLIAGIKRTWQFHKCNGTKTKWFMEEYIPANYWGTDIYMESVLRFRVVYESTEVHVPGEPTSPKEKNKNKIAAVKKHRMRGPENLVIKGESPVWQHFIKIYDRHPELEGSKVVYAMCCYCAGVHKAGTGNGTNSLSTHCNRTCPVKNRNQQPRSSRY